MMVCLALATLLLMTNAALAQSYNPVGVQTNVPMSTVLNGGWTECYSDLYGDSGTLLSSLEPLCQGTRVMLACSEVGGNEFVVLGQAPIEDVVFNTGTGNTTHAANGIEWYFNESYSWGFAPSGETVSRTSCDTNATAADQRLCWHTVNEAFSGGWRCGATTNLNSSTTWARHILVNGAVPETASVPVNSNYALALLILVFSGIGYITIRRYS